MDDVTDDIEEKATAFGWVIGLLGFGVLTFILVLFLAFLWLI